MEHIGDPLQYAQNQWEGILKMPLVSFSAVSPDTLGEAQASFLEKAVPLITQSLDAASCLDTTLTTLYVLAY